ncbi:MAG: hypothetical protein KME21_19075 [Desmonostoc vinosum HA7617-LM4]|nr:hypothetical protein [Desmonostoc vinosum HA7617-LM4]
MIHSHWDWGLGTGDWGLGTGELSSIILRVPSLPHLPFTLQKQYYYGKM